ncbi:MAG TPA: hypothetical protein VF623_09120 [Segetibacter sp.]|jgi:hypothetical protein
MLDYKKIIFLTLSFIMAATAFAREQNLPAKPVDNGVMVSQGKIYVVMVVVITILGGLLAFVSRLDRKITKLEKGETL